MGAQRGGVGLAFALLSAATFSSSGSFATALIGAGWSPGAAVTVRVVLAAAILAVPAAIALRGRWSLLRRQAWSVLLYGLIAIAACQLFYFLAVQRLSVGVALLLEYLGVVLVVLWQWLRHGNRPRRLTLAGAALAVAGLVLVLDLFGEAHLDFVGVLWGLGAGVGLATYFVLSARGDGGLPPVTMAGGGLVVGAVALVALGAAGLLPLHATFGAVDLAGHQFAWWVPLVAVAVISTVIPYTTGIAGARHLGAKLASFVGLTEVLFAVLVAWLALGQVPTVLQAAGGALIIAGVALVRADEFRSVPARAGTLVAADPRRADG